MKPPSALRTLLILAGLRLLMYVFINAHYGFHRDELATLDDARNLAWGFVADPPLTPFLARVALVLFGPTPAGVRAITAIAQCIVMIVAGLMARELGGGRSAQIISAVAVAVSPVSIIEGHLFQYVSFDLLWGVLTTYFVLRLLKSHEDRWWIAIGATVGLGLMTRYTIAWLVAGLTIGFLVTPARRRLISRWFIAACALALAICAPNLIWQAQHNFIALDFLQSIHARDIRIGRTDGFLWRQLLISSDIFTIPLWIAGLWFYFRKKEGVQYRAVGWTFVATLLLFAAARARDYYTAPLYPMLLAAGAVVAASTWPRWARNLNWAGLAIAFAMGVVLLLPVAPANSRWFEGEARINGDLPEEIGWQDLVDRIADIRNSLPLGERNQAGILAGNVGEGGAVDLYGPALGLPPALGLANSFWLRGYGDHPPDTLIVVGLPPKFVHANFNTCESEGMISNRLGVANEETKFDRYLWVCRGLKESWPLFWRKARFWD